MSSALRQTTGGKDEPNMVFMRKSQRTSQHGTKNVKTNNSTKCTTRTPLLLNIEHEPHYY
jgi:hypothetical protein